MQTDHPVKRLSDTPHVDISIHALAGNPSASQTESSSCRVIRRNGKQTPFDRSKIVVAMTKAFLAVEGGHAAASSRVHEKVMRLSGQVVDALFRYLPEHASLHIENIQDQVELALMRNGEQAVARAYVLYREQHAQLREQQKVANAEQGPAQIEDQQIVRLGLQADQYRSITISSLQLIFKEVSAGLDRVRFEDLLDKVRRAVFEGMSEDDFYSTLIMSARSLIDQEPQYSQLSARLLLLQCRREALSYIYKGEQQVASNEMQARYADYFTRYIKCAVELELLDEELKCYDLDVIAAAIKPERDYQFTYLGLQTLYDRYFIHKGDIKIELPQAFFMRVAMGLAINEVDRDVRVIEFYNILSTFKFMSSTPTLFNAGTRRPQLSSCYLTTIPDDLDGIYSSMKDNALLSKYAGGLGNDWTRVRGLGAYIKGTNGQSQGVVPFLKVANDTAVAVNQGGKRKGAMCAYLETWHIDIEDFLELRKNTGDDRRRTHDMNTANWIPDLFMKRVIEEGSWTLFSPDEVPELHDLYGEEFEVAYCAYEQKAQRGEIALHRVVGAQDLWRKMLGMLFETGHPWLSFKDPCNIRYTNQHIGCVHSSNLCTEITLHTDDSEIAVCNLGSVNLSSHVTTSGLDKTRLQETITTAMRMLDNVIDYNYYSVAEARSSNLKHRPVGLGIMGFQDALYKQYIPYGDQRAVDFADLSMELVSYYAIKASSDLALERGRYPSYAGSLWSQGILPIDSHEILLKQRGQYMESDCSRTQDWDSLRKLILQQGMRNSNCLAIAPTATISNICGVSQSIEPAYQNLFVKSNLSGEFTVVNTYLVQELQQRQLWDAVMVNDLKYYDGSIQKIDRIPKATRSLFATAFELDSCWLIEAAARRQKWIDQSQSLNLYIAEASGKKLDQLYKLAWLRGLKTTYYLRSLAATQMEKSVMQNEAPEPVLSRSHSEVATCSIADPECEACQ